MAQILCAIGSLPNARPTLGALKRLTEKGVKDEADAWERARPKQDVVFQGPTTHEVYRRKTTRLIDGERFVPPVKAAEPRTNATALDGELEKQRIRARFSLEKSRATTRR